MSNRGKLKARKKEKESEGKEEKKNTMQINNEEEKYRRRMLRLEPLEGPIDDWFKVRMKTGRVFEKNRKRKKKTSE